MKRFVHTIDQISEWSGKIFSYFLLVTMLVIGFEVIMRMFNKPQIWVFDITLYTAGIVYVIGGGLHALEESTCQDGRAL